jgi:hypothetical protein
VADLLELETQIAALAEQKTAWLAEHKAQAAALAKAKATLLRRLRGEPDPAGPIQLTIPGTGEIIR